MSLLGSMVDYCAVKNIFWCFDLGGDATFSSNVLYLCNASFKGALAIQDVFQSDELIYCVENMR